MRPQQCDKEGIFQTDLVQNLLFSWTMIPLFPNSYTVLYRLAVKHSSQDSEHIMLCQRFSIQV